MGQIIQFHSDAYLKCQREIAAYEATFSRCALEETDLGRLIDAEKTLEDIYFRILANINKLPLQKNIDFLERKLVMSRIAMRRLANEKVLTLNKLKNMKKS